MTDNAKTQDTPKPNPAPLVRQKSGQKTTPWKPASILSLTFQESGKRYRFGKPERHDKKLQEGWIPVEKGAKDAPKILEDSLVDGSPLGSYASKRGLILYKMSEEIAQARDKYYSDQANVALDKEVEDFEDQNTRSDGKVITYGNIKVGKGNQ